MVDDNLEPLGARVGVNCRVGIKVGSSLELDLKSLQLDSSWSWFLGKLQELELEVKLPELDMFELGQFWCSGNLKELELKLFIHISLA